MIDPVDEKTDEGRGEGRERGGGKVACEFPDHQAEAQGQQEFGAQENRIPNHGAPPGHNDWEVQRGSDHRLALAKQRNAG